MVTYGTTVIPSEQIDVVSGGTVAISAAFDNSVGLIGGMDTSNGSASPGSAVRVRSPSDASSKFGQNSELHEQCTMAFGNGAGTVHAFPVEETSVTGETQSAQNGTLDNAPIFDPRVNDEHSISCADSGGGSLTVDIADSPPSSAPSSSDTVKVYPPTGEYYADAAPSGSNYEFDYSYGDYSTTAVQPLLDESPRIVGVCTESQSVFSNVLSELDSRADDFDFMHAVAGVGNVRVDPPTYSDGIDDRRGTLVAPPRGWRDSAETNEQRVVGAVAGELASLALGLSATNNGISGLLSLKNDLGGPSDAGTLIDAQVMPLLDYSNGGVTIVKDMTTSTTTKFERIITMQVVDEATELTHLLARNYVGEQNTPENREALDYALNNTFLGMELSSPPMLNDSTVLVTQDTADDNTVNVEIGLDVVDVMDAIDVTITVGDIIRNGGAS